MTVRYTFFEMATQKGHIMQVFSELLPRHWTRWCVSTPDGESFTFEAVRNAATNEPEISLTITGRSNRETHRMWMERARREAQAAWNQYTKRREERAAARRATESTAGPLGEAASLRASVEADTARAKALLESTNALLTPLPTASERSSTATGAEASAASGSALSGRTRPNSATSRTSTPASGKALSRKGSKSLSSSGESTESTTVDTAPAVSTSPES